MPTTTLRLDSNLKARIATAAKRARKSPHNFMLEALSEMVAEDERRDQFERAAEEGMAQIATTDEVLEWGQTRRWLEARALGKKTAKPRARTLQRLK